MVYYHQLYIQRILTFNKYKTFNNKLYLYEAPFVLARASGGAMDTYAVSLDLEEEMGWLRLNFTERKRVNLQSQIDVSSVFTDFLNIVIWNALEIAGNHGNVDIAVGIGRPFGNGTEKISLRYVDPVSD